MSDYESFLLETLTWEEVEELVTDTDLVALPCGSFEQHSHHLPLSVDSVRAEALTAELARLAPEFDLGMLVLPTLTYGVSERHMHFPGTVTLRPDTYQDVLVDVGMSVARHGFERLLLANYHGGNRPSIRLAADRLQREHGITTHTVNWSSFARSALADAFGEEWAGGHAGAHETSLIQHYRPELVREERITAQTRGRNPLTRPMRYFEELTVEGGTGDPTRADVDAVPELVEDTSRAILAALRADIDADTSAR